MNLQTIAIIPAPTGSQIVEGPYGDDEDSVSFEPCAFLALVTDSHGENHVIPVGFGDVMDADLTHHTATLEPSHEAAQAEMDRRIRRIRKNKNP